MNRDIAGLIGLNALHERLLKSFRAGRILHAYLFCGDQGTGKNTFAHHLAQASVCEAAEKPCGECPPCRRFLSGNHADVYTVSPEGASTKIEQIRALRDWMKNAAFEGGRKMLFLPEAHKMTVQAQNALLKSLEEPSGDAVFFLMTDRPQALLATIESRAMHIQMPLLSSAQVEEILLEKGIDAQSAGESAALSGGSVGRALAIAQDAPLRALRAELLRAFGRVRDYGDIAGVLTPELTAWTDKFALLEMAQDIFRQKMLDESAGEAPENRFTMGASAYMINTIGKIERRARSNVSMNAIWDMLFIAAVEGIKKYG